MSNNPQGAYAPLPQSQSDSDSEKEPSAKQRRSVKFAVEPDDDDLQNGDYCPFSLDGFPEVKKIQPIMSLQRKACFVVSVAVCFATMGVFLWGLPCDDKGTCPTRISNWETQHDGIELTGKINVVKSAFRNVRNLVVLFKRDVRYASNPSGVISLLGSNGAVAWYINQAVPPAQLNCYLLDVNDDGIDDCLVISRVGLEAVDPITGDNFWFARNHTRGQPMAGLDLPIILQDLNGDNVREILTTYNKDGECKLLILSGKTGRLMGEIAVKSCDDFHIVESNATSIVYLRLRKNHAYYHRVGLADLTAGVFERLPVLDPPVYDRLPTVDFGYALNGRRLTIDNLGVCQTNRLRCPVKITLTDERLQRKLFSWTYQNAYGFKPVSFAFKRTRLNLSALKAHLDGFIIKLWEWADSPTSTNITTVTERVLLITFNSTNFHVVNASLTNVTRLCTVGGGESNQDNCQPSLANQEDSLAIADLDGDGSKEFVSYTSGFVRRGGDDDWQLVSTVKVIKLETELPKLFGVGGIV